MLQVKEIFSEILVSLTAIISNDLFVHFSTPDHQSFCSMSMHLYGKKIGSFFYLMILVLAFHQCQNI